MIPPHRPHVHHYHLPHHPPRWRVKPSYIYELSRENPWSLLVKAGQKLGLIKPGVDNENDLRDWLLKLKDRQEQEKSLAFWEQSIRLPNPSAFTYRAYGSSLSDLGRYEEALAAFEQAIRLDPNEVSNYIGKGSVLSDLGRYEEALAAFEQAIRLDPNLSGPYKDKAEVLEHLGRSNEAQQFHEKYDTILSQFGKE